MITLTKTFIKAVFKILSGPFVIDIKRMRTNTKHRSWISQVLKFTSFFF